MIRLLSGVRWLRGVAVAMNNKKSKCIFNAEVECLRNVRDIRQVWRCEGCVHLKEFEDEMDVDEEEFFREVDAIRRLL